MTITEQSLAGTRSASATHTVIVPVDAALAPGATRWTRTKDRNAYAGTLTVSSSNGRSLHLTESGSTFGVLLHGSKNGGQAAVFLDGHRVKTADTYRAGTTEMLSIKVRANHPGRHTLTVLVLGTHTHRSTGNVVAVDAFTYS